MSVTSVRFARREDLETARLLLTAQLVEHALPVDEAGMRGVLATIGDSREEATTWLLLAERSGDPVGICLANRIVSVEKGGGAIWIEELYVVPAARRMGVATELLAAVAGAARRMGARSLELEVVRTQAAAFALYDRLGFSRVDRQRMSLDLARS